MALLSEVQELTNIINYDASSSTVLVADKSLQDFTRVTMTVSESVKEEQGIDPVYYVPVTIPSVTTISIHVLPNSEDARYLESLKDFIENNGGYFYITISNSGRFVGNYSAYFKKGSDMSIDIEPDDEVFEFGAIREDKGLFSRINRTVSGSLIDPFDNSIVAQ